MRKSKKILNVIPYLLLLLVVLWQLFLANKTSYYLVSVIVLIMTLIPWLSRFERKKQNASEISLMAMICAIAVVSRAVFYLLPQVKPIAAVVIIAGICFGAERGFIIGVFSAFVSNFIFGQGIWTPFQMVALGFVGLLGGIIFKKIKPTKTSMAIVGFLLSFFVYGIIVDLSSVLMMLSDITIGGVLSIYASGIPFSLVFGVSTSLFLFLFGEQFINKIQRIKTKYGLFLDN